MFIKRFLMWTTLLLFVCAFAQNTFAKDVKLKGSYKWVKTKGSTGGDFTATFTPDGDNKWKVEFKFDWKKKPHTYTGTATGSVKDGKLEGKVLNDDKKRTFTFTGTMKNGKMTDGTHTEIRKKGGKESVTDTGTILMEVTK